MSRDKHYQKLLNSKRWAAVKRIVWQRAEGLCERCKREGFITAGVDCHHKVPVESANPDDPEAMKRLAYDVNNIELLCIPCHIKTHQEMRTHTKEKVKENKERARRRFLEANDPNYGAKADAYLKNLEEQAKMEYIIYPDDDPNYGAKADAYLKNLEEQAKMEYIIYPDDDPNKTPI